VDGCVAPKASSFTLKTAPTPERDTLSFSWRGTTIPVSDFGDPTASTDVRLCVYANGGLVLNAVVPAASSCDGTPCWVATNTTGFRYTDRDASSDGLRRVVLRAGTNPKIAVNGRGPRLTLPSLPLSLPVTVQVQAENGNCWDSEFSAASQSARGLRTAR